MRRVGRGGRVARRVGGDPPRVPGAHRWRGALDPHRRRGPVPRCAGSVAAAGRAGAVPRAQRGAAGRARGPVRTNSLAVRGCRRWPSGGRYRSRWCGRRCSGSKAPAWSCTATSGRAGPNASGATRRCCGSCDAGHSHGFVGRWSRSPAGRSHASCSSGRAWGAAGMAHRGYGRYSRSSKGCRCRRRCSNGMCSRRVSMATSRRCWTSSGRRAKWHGWGVAALGGMTGESPLCGANTSRISPRRPAATIRKRHCTRSSWRHCASAEPRSSPTWWALRGQRPGTSSTLCGTSSGPGW